MTPLRAQERVYNLAKNSDQELAIGRLPDTAAAAKLGMRRLNDPDWDTDLTVNDAWVYGAISARKKIYLASPVTSKNILSDKYGLTVFCREIDQLKRNGYSQEGDYMMPPQEVK